MDGNGRWAESRGLAGRRGPPGRHAGAPADGRGRDRARRRHARRLRVLDRELGAPRRRGRRPDGDPLRDDRPRAARSRRAGRAHAIHRPPRPARAVARREDDRARGETADLDTLDLWIAFDYGGRAELVAGGPTARRGRRRAVRGSTRRRWPRGSTRRRSREIDLLDPDVGRAPALELPPLGGGLRGARVHRDALARLRRGRPPRGGRGVRRAPAPVRRAGIAHEPARLAARRRRGAAAARPRRRLARRLVAVRARARRRAAGAARALRDRTRAATARARRLRGPRADAARRAARRPALDPRRDPRHPPGRAARLLRLERPAERGRGVRR